LHINRWANTNLLGSSVMFKLASRHAISFRTRIRRFANINRIHGELYETHIDDDAIDKSFPIDIKNLNISKELRLICGAAFYSSENNFFKSGITL
jgi:hypothetical protein